MIYVVSLRDRVPKDAVLVNVTSRGQSELSPFYLGPCKLYGDYESCNVENGWQYSKVYSQFDNHGKPEPEYFVWAMKGWDDIYAHRHPMGKSARPRYSWWDGKKLGYVEARKKIYVPLYAEQVVKTGEYKRLQRIADSGQNLALQDFDAYRYDLRSMTLSDVLNEPNWKMGHAFVLAMLLENDDALKECDMRRVASD